MAHAFDIDTNDFSRIKILAAEAFALGQEYGALKEDLKKEFSERLSQLIAGFRGEGAPVSDVPTPDCDRMNRVIRLANIGEGVIVEPERALAIPQPPLAGQPASPPWTTLKEAFLKDKPGLTKKTLWSYHQAFDAWERLIGPKPISDIRRADLKAYADFLRDKPNPRGGGLDHKSIARSLGHIKIFMVWAVKAGHLEDDRFGDVQGRDKTREESVSDDDRRAFTPAEMEMLFNSPLFRQPMDEADKAAAWFLAIAALTGGRTEEIAEAPAELVKRGNVLCLDLREVGKKTRAAPRLVPILPDLIRLGLPAWSARQAALGRLLVQPGAETRSPAAWSKYLNRFIDKHVTDAPDLVLYSLRHSYRQMLRAGNIGDELINKVFGHKTGTVGAGYGKDLSAQEAELVFQAVRPPVDLSHLRVWG